ncbi:hypothetical protein V8E36_001095 [Tilletia maclaganii]
MTATRTAVPLEDDGCSVTNDAARPVNIFAFAADDNESVDQALYESSLAALTEDASSWKSLVCGLQRDWLHDGASEPPSYVLPRVDPRGDRWFDQRRTAHLRINGLPEFERVFHDFTAGSLRDLDYNNTLVAGGSVLTCLTQPESPGVDVDCSDVDIFLYGLTAAAATRKTQAIEHCLRQNIPGFEEAYYVQRNIHVITFVPTERSTYSRKFQVILRLYRSAAAVLASFDLDQVAVGYDGTEVWLQPRAVRALLTGYTLLTATVLRKTTAARLTKYALRGFGVILRVHDVGESTALLLQDRIRSIEENMERRAAEFVRPYFHGGEPITALLNHARCRIDSSWTDTLTDFVTLAAVWNQAVQVDCGVGTLAEYLRRGEVPYTGLDLSAPPRSATVSASLNEDEWPDVTGRTYSLLSSACLDWSVRASSVSELIKDPHLYCLYVPQTEVPKVMAIARRQGVGHALTQPPGWYPLWDTTRGSALLVEWKQSTEWMWHPWRVDSDPACDQLHSTLRSAAVASQVYIRAASTHHSSYKPRYGAVLTTLRKASLRDLDWREDRAQLVAWSRGDEI